MDPDRMLHERYMRLALEEAQKAYALGEVPVGAVLVQGERLLCRAHNLREQRQDPTAHAELLAIQEASRILGRRKLGDCTLYVTLEPCPMCAGAMIMAGLGACFFGAADTRQGCVESLYCLCDDASFYHNVACCGGILEEEAQRLLLSFFKERRP